MEPSILLGVVAIILATPPFLLWVQVVIRWRRRRWPLRVEVSPHPHRDDAIFVTVTNVGDEDLVLAWCPVTYLKRGYLVGGVNGPVDVHRMPIDRDYGAIFMLERDQLAVPGVRWVKVEAFDLKGHHASAPISMELSSPLES